MNNKLIIPTLNLAYKIIKEQFPEYASLTIFDIDKQGHDNRTYRLGQHMLIRMPSSSTLRFKSSKRARATAIISKTFKF